MAPMLTIIISIFFFAIIVDYILSEDKIKAWKKASAAAWESLGQADLSDTILRANTWFLELFDLVYDRKLFSSRRATRSIISSYFALIIMLLFFGQQLIMEQFSVQKQSQWEAFILFFFFGGLLNLIPDFISLHETRWIMEKSLRTRSRSLVLWFLIDLILTALIFFLFVLFLMGIQGSTKQFAPLASQLLGNPSQYDARILLWGLYFLSTFFTSALWFIFLIFALMVHGLQRISPFIRVLLKVIAQSERPARTTAGFISVGLMLSYSIYYLIIMIFNKA